VPQRDFKTTSDAVSDLYVRYLKVEDDLRAKATDAYWSDDGMYYISESARAEAWAWFEAERKKLVESLGWTPEEYKAAEDADQEAFYESLKYCSDCGKLRHEGFDCGGDVLPPIEIIHMDGIEPEPEDEP